jgi:uncharacterized membrane protein
MSVAASPAARPVTRLRAALGEVPPASVAVGLLTLALLGLRFSQIHQSLFGDELWTYQQIHGHSLASMFRAIHPGAENAPPLFFVLAWFSAKLGDPTVWIRLPSVLLGTATVPVIYALGRQTVGVAAGLIGAAMFAVGPFSAYYGIEARPYATVAFFVILSTLALVKAVRSGSRGWWVLYVVAALAAAYTHYTAAFALLVQGLWGLWVCRDRWRVPLAANAGIVLLYLPWIPHLKSKELGIIGFLEPLNLHNIRLDLGKASVGYPLATLHAIPTIPGLVAIAVCAAIGALALVLGHRRGVAAVPLRWPPGLALIVALTLATPIGVLLYSLLATDIWDARDLYASVPAGALLLGTLLAAIPGKLRLIAVVVVVGTLLAGTIRAISPSYARPPFRAAAQYLDHVAGPRDPIILYPSYLQLNEVILIHFHRPHVLVKGVPSHWPTAPPGGAAYVILSEQYDAAVHRSTPHPRGYRLVARKNYTGTLDFTVLTYRPVHTA